MVVVDIRNPSFLQATGWTRNFSIVKHQAKNYWQRAIGQCSLLLNFDYHPWNMLTRLSLGLVEATREGQKAGKKIMLTDEIVGR